MVKEQELTLNILVLIKNHFKNFFFRLHTFTNIYLYKKAKATTFKAVACTYQSKLVGKLSFSLI